MLKLGLLLLILPLLILMISWGIEYNQVSNCIYLGGSFDYPSGECLTEGQGIFISYAERNPQLVNISLSLALVGFLLTTTGLYRGKK